MFLVMLQQVSAKYLKISDHWQHHSERNRQQNSYIEPSKFFQRKKNSVLSVCEVSWRDIERAGDRKKMKESLWRDLLCRDFFFSSRRSLKITEGCKTEPTLLSISSTEVKFYLLNTYSELLYAQLKALRVLVGLQYCLEMFPSWKLKGNAHGI